jgi:hypothetical protein
MSLKDTVLKDAKGRTGYIAANKQLQFDEPPQAGYETAVGFSICTNGTIALGDSAVFYACNSGDFSNIYSESVAEQCEPIHLGAIACGEDAADIPSPVGAPAITTVVPAVSNGVETTITTVLPIPLCQINDGKLSLALFSLNVPYPPQPFVNLIADHFINRPGPSSPDALRRD